MRRRASAQAAAYVREAHETRASLVGERVDALQSALDDAYSVARAARRVVADDAKVRERVQTLRRVRAENHFTDRVRAMIGVAHG